MSMPSLCSVSAFSRIWTDCSTQVLFLRIKIYCTVVEKQPESLKPHSQYLSSSTGVWWLARVFFRESNFDWLFCSWYPSQDVRCRGAAEWTEEMDPLFWGSHCCPFLGGHQRLRCHLAGRWRRKSNAGSIDAVWYHHQFSVVHTDIYDPLWASSLGGFGCFIISLLLRSPSDPNLAFDPSSFEQDRPVQTKTILLTHLAIFSRYDPFDQRYRSERLTYLHSSLWTHSDYAGDDTDYEASRSYFKDRFVRLNRSSKKEIYTHVRLPLLRLSKLARLSLTLIHHVSSISIHVRQIPLWCELWWLRLQSMFLHPSTQPFVHHALTNRITQYHHHPKPPEHHSIVPTFIHPPPTPFVPVCVSSSRNRNVLAIYPQRSSRFRAVNRRSRSTATSLCLVKTLCAPIPPHETASRWLPSHLVVMWYHHCSAQHPSVPHQVEHIHTPPSVRRRSIHLCFV